jgi:hypothetical protein
MIRGLKDLFDENNPADSKILKILILTEKKLLLYQKYIRVYIN